MLMHVQFLESYKSVTLESMATAFDVGLPFLDTEVPTRAALQCSIASVAVRCLLQQRPLLVPCVPSGPLLNHWRCSSVGRWLLLVPAVHMAATAWGMRTCTVVGTFCALCALLAACVRHMGFVDCAGGGVLRCAGG